MNNHQQLMWEFLAKQRGEDVLRLLTSWHGMSLLDEGLFDRLVGEGRINIGKQRVEDNCDAGVYNCDACILNGDCPHQGMDGQPDWLEELLGRAQKAEAFVDFCSVFEDCAHCPLAEEAARTGCIPRWRSWKTKRGAF